MGWVDIGRLLEEKERRGWEGIALATYGQWLLSWSSQIQNIPSQRVLLDRIRQIWFWLCLLQVLWIESNDFPFPSLSFLICKTGILRVSPCGKASSLAIKNPHKIQLDHISQPLLQFSVAIWLSSSHWNTGSNAKCCFHLKLLESALSPFFYLSSCQCKEQWGLRVWRSRKIEATWVLNHCTEERQTLISKF